MAAPVMTLVTYRPKKGREDDLAALVKRHWTVLRGVGLATTTPARTWRGKDKRSGAPLFVEMFEWVDENASETAHQLPEVMAVWETMGPMLDSMEILRLQPLE